MGFRFNKRIKIAKGVNINLSKKGISTSVKVGKTTINSRGRVTTNLGRGLSHQVTLQSKKVNDNNGNREVIIESNDPRLNRINDLELAIENIYKVWNKPFNIFLKVLFGLVSIMSLILSIINPFMLIVVLIAGYVAIKINLLKLRDEKISKWQNEIEVIINQMESDNSKG